METNFFLFESIFNLLALTDKVTFTTKTPFFKLASMLWAAKYDRQIAESKYNTFLSNEGTPHFITITVLGNFETEIHIEKL